MRVCGPGCGLDKIMTTRKRHSLEQVVRKLMAADRLLAEGKDTAAVCRELGVSEATYHRWRNQFGGLVILFSTGARLGYRQAKAGFAVRTAGIASFLRSGAVPLGAVRSGSLVVIRPRALRVVRPGALSADHLLDRVA